MTIYYIRKNLHKGNKLVIEIRKTGSFSWIVNQISFSIKVGGISWPRLLGPEAVVIQAIPMKIVT